MSKYELTTEGRIKLKKVWTVTILGAYAAIIGVFAYNLLYRTGDTISVTIFAVILAALTGFFFYGRKKYFLNTDSTELTVDDDRITLHVSGQPDVAITFENISQVKPAKQGIYLINKFPSKKSLFVMNKFECFDEIQKLVADRVKEYSMLTVR
ncbi:hypothetical protein [Mucilaginibacter sp.]|uniref:hypothetical protein n=1 Tax=Mucilaginibacter sp. TaxID=1882438 RepID=UPI00326421B1